MLIVDTMGLKLLAGVSQSAYSGIANLWSIRGHGFLINVR